MPRRSIPVRVAPTPTRQLPARAALPPRPLDMPGPGQLRCRRCGRLQPSDRRFCDCAAPLATPPSDDRLVAPRAPSWVGEWRAHRRFRSAQRAAAAGAPVGYDAPLHPRTRIVRALGVLLVAAAVGSQLGPWGPGLRAEVRERVDHVVGTLPVDREGGHP